MLTKVDGRIKFDFAQCQQCGVCRPVCPKDAISYERRADGLQDIKVDPEACVLCGRCVVCCPSTIDESYDAYRHIDTSKKYALACSTSPTVRSEASSGGVARTLIVESLRRGIVDAVYAIGPTREYPMAGGMLYTQDAVPALSDVATSVYHSVMIGDGIKDVGCIGRMMLVGTACQLKAVAHALKGKCKNIIKVCIFCKQQKTLDSTRFLAKVLGAPAIGDPRSTVTLDARYRGDNWPGIVRINGKGLPYHRAAQIPFGRRLWTVPGCNVCGDPIGINAEADLTLMDPWKIEPYGTPGKTLVIIGTPSGQKLLDEMTGALEVETRSYDEVEPALDRKDIWRKQQLVPYFRGYSCSREVERAGLAEKLQRRWLAGIVTFLPRMPILFYRILCKFPDLRNKILK